MDCFAGARNDGENFSVRHSGRVADANPE